ncbi:MAG: hypothetical protein JXR79_05680 [Nitrospirae bacterium]|nr:hypothetical protein [Nitrospirota bacterium]
MKGLKGFLVVLLMFFAVVSIASAAKDFAWMDALNVKAGVSPNDFFGQVAARFKVGNAEVEAVFGKVGRYADAYMAFRLGEMSGKPVGYVVDRYSENRGKGWGVLAKSLGIKPGSKEFHALKRGHDLRGFDGSGSKGKAKNNNKNKDKGQGKGKGN